MNENYLPCPFCGSSAIIGDRNDPFKLGGMHTNGPSWFTIGCLKCGFYFCEQDYKGQTKRQQTIDAWNTRYER